MPKVIPQISSSFPQIRFSEAKVRCLTAGSYSAEAIYASGQAAEEPRLGIGRLRCSPSWNSWRHRPEAILAPASLVSLRTGEALSCRDRRRHAAQFDDKRKG
jgi:hypothetical protein